MKVRFLIFAMLFLFHLIPCTAQTNSAEIQKLIKEFVNSAKTGADLDSFLTPNVSGPERARRLEIARKGFVDLEISGFLIEKDLVTKDANHASLPISIRWETRNRSFEYQSTIRFEKVDSK
jgi:hypothetical protein